MDNQPPVTAESIERSIEVEVIDRDLYRSIQLWKPGGGRGVFGGQIIAQALWAATQSVRRDEPGTLKQLHSLHSYFLSFGNADVPVIYRVERLRDGKSYSTRGVLASQCGVPIFTLTCSFALAEPSQRTHTFPEGGLPSWPRSLGATKDNAVPPQPENCSPTEDRLQKVLDGTRELPPKIKEYLQRNAEERRLSSIEIRNVDPLENGHLMSSKRDGQRQPEQMYWFRSRAPVKKDPAFQKCVLAYASDMNFIGTAARAAGLGGGRTNRLGMIASLDHAMYFYDDTVDASDFLLFYMESPIVSSGRGLVEGKIYKRDGTLAVVCVQEGVVRAAL